MTDQAELIQCSVWQTLPNLAAIVSCHYDSDLYYFHFPRRGVIFFMMKQQKVNHSVACSLLKRGATFTCVTINGSLFLFELMNRLDDYNLDNIGIARKQIAIAVIFVDSQQKRKLKNDY